MRKFKTVVIDYDDSLSGDRIELTYNLGRKVWNKNQSKRIKKDKLKNKFE